MAPVGNEEKPLAGKDMRRRVFRIKLIGRIPSRRLQVQGSVWRPQKWCADCARKKRLRST